MIMPSKLLRLPSNGRTIFISCCIEESLLYLSAIDFSRNLMWKIVDSLYVVKSPIMCSSSDAILYEWQVAQLEITKRDCSVSMVIGGQTQIFEPRILYGIIAVLTMSVEFVKMFLKVLICVTINSKQHLKLTQQRIVKTITFQIRGRCQCTQHILD